MYSYTFDNIRRKKTTAEYDLMQKTVMNQYTINLIPYMVTEDQEMRLDRVCNDIYGNTALIEELMCVNGILNPWSIKKGDVLGIFKLDDVRLLQLTEPEDIDPTALSNPEKNTQRDPNRLPPSTNPGLKQVTLDTKARKIKIIDRLS